MSLLRASQLGYDIDGIPVLRGVDLEVAPGELVGLIGPNGAGKSSLLRLLAGVQPSLSGKIAYNHIDLSQISLEQRARKIGYLAQGAKAYWPSSVEKIIELGRMPHRTFWQEIGWNNDAAEEKRKVEAAMRLTETLAYRNRIVTTLSGGEQTLVMLARLFAGEPELVCADEPVAALDPYHQLHVMELLRDHVRSNTTQANKAAIVILHDLGLAARFCDRLYLLHHGALYAQGTPAQVLTDENMAEVYGVKVVMECSDRGTYVTPVARLKDFHP